jgi:SP family facilitated glucose transporter-like MFS transporter 8
MQWRGMLLSILMTCAALGNLITYIIGSFVNWRILALLCGGVPLACGPFLCLLPESPTKLVQVGKEQEALEAMVWLRGNKYRQSETDIQDIKKHIDEAEARQPSYKFVIQLVMSYLQAHY